MRKLRILYRVMIMAVGAWGLGKGLSEGARCLLKWDPAEVLHGILRYFS